MSVSTSGRVSKFIRYGRCGAFLAGALVLAQAVSAPAALAQERDRRNDNHDGKEQATTTVVSMPLTGTGVEARVAFSTPSPALTSRPANTEVKNGIITVANTGNAPLKLTAAPSIVKTSGDAANKFTIAGGSCSSGKELLASGTCTIMVKYMPANRDNSAAHVTLTVSGTSEAQHHSETFDGN